MLPWQKTTHFFKRYLRITLFSLSIFALVLKQESFALTMAYFSAHDITKNLLVQTGEWIPEVIIDVECDKDGSKEDCEDNDQDEGGDGNDGNKEHTKKDDGDGDNDKRNQKEHGQDGDDEGDGHGKEHPEDHADDGDRHDDEKKDNEKDDKDKDRDADKKDEKDSFCIRLSASLPDTRIYYEFSDDDDDPIDGGEEYDTEERDCLPVSKRSHFLQVQAVREQNDEWKSEVETVDLFSICKDEEDDDDHEHDHEHGENSHEHGDDEDH
ncbi:MAG: hypothetical protein PHT88_01825 [Candidatus Moranbacteria bacterium]|nr:hypothetical protein [Candidatus Moranbacteria bacterium]